MTIPNSVALKTAMETAIATPEPTAPALATKPKTVMDLLKDPKVVEGLQKIAGATMSAERLVKFFAVCASRTPRLKQCTWLSFWDAMVKCSELNLYPGTFGSVYLIPFENRKAGTIECQMIVGYQGLMALARRSSDIQSIDAQVVRQNDVFEFEYGLNPVFRHKPAMGESGEMTHVWAMAKFTNGGHQLVVMTADEVERIRGMSRAGNSGPWIQHRAEMWKKTALRRLCKLLPLTPELTASISTAERDEFEMDLPENPQGFGGDFGSDKAEHVGSVADRIVSKVEKASGAAHEPAADTPRHQEVREQAAKIEAATPATGGEDLSFLSKPETVERGPKRRGT